MYGSSFLPNRKIIRLNIDALLISKIPFFIDLIAKRRLSGSSRKYCIPHNHTPKIKHNIVWC